ncbi:S41 family peptidase [Sphingomonas sp. PAMC 26621]|uniref:S41 family peptidase n=1 Tax=Sphingomonas sp. PAMC 26621 TaxID=1112213 RepID=UPI0002886911|nr:S41 family peptidase [Sphingomonas sp. PAMC 26621]
MRISDRFRASVGDPAAKAQEGDFLLAVDGEPLKAPDDPYGVLAEHHSPLTLTIATTSDGPTHTITVDPVASEGEIRKLDWIARNRTMVERLSGGRVCYAYLSDFNALGSEDFLRQYYRQADKAGMVIDVRGNLGGFTSQSVLDLLRRPQGGIFSNREGGVIALPGAIAPPRLVMVTNLFSASDGDQFPYYFRTWGMGAVIGQRTLGGVRGIKGPWLLIDGTYITVPKDSLLTEAGAKIIENRGAEPDIVVDDSPADRIAGRDRHLEQAVVTVMGSAVPGQGGNRRSVK